MKLCFDEGTGTDPATNQLTYTYDGLNRLTQVLNTQNYVTPMYTRNYGYKDYDGSGSRTTGLLDSYVYRKPSDDSIISGNAYDYSTRGTQHRGRFSVLTIKRICDTLKQGDNNAKTSEKESGKRHLSYYAAWDQSTANI